MIVNFCNNSYEVHSFSFPTILMALNLIGIVGLHSDTRLGQGIVLCFYNFYDTRNFFLPFYIDQSLIMVIKKPLDYAFSDRLESLTACMKMLTNLNFL